MQKLEIQSEQGITVVTPGPDYDSIYEISLPDFEVVLNLAQTVEPPLVLLDLMHTKYFGSAFLGFLVRLSNRLTVQRNGRLGLCHLSKFCLVAITAAKMDTLFDLYETRAQAITAMKGESS